MTNSLPWFFAMALIEIDGLPSYKMGGSFHGELLNNQMVYKKACLMWDVGELTKGHVLGELTEIDKQPQI